jgi:hypothetical protein
MCLMAVSDSDSNPVLRKDSRTWTWAVQRAAIACRWMWLIAQVADLEFKIRQQKEMYHTLRQSKGQIVLENRAGDSADGSEPSHCMRTMSLKHLNKRKLVRCSSALTGAVRKVARYSTVPCSCTSLPNFVSACVLCNGRFGYVQVIDTDCMPQSERIAILDPACHPVLTLPTRKSTSTRNHCVTLCPLISSFYSCFLLYINNPVLRPQKSHWGCTFPSS